MTIRVQIELSDEDYKIVELYRIEHNKKNNEEAIEEIIKHYKPLNKDKKEEHKRSWRDL